MRAARSMTHENHALAKRFGVGIGVGIGIGLTSFRSRQQFRFRQLMATAVFETSLYALFIAQGLNGIERGRLVGGIKTEKNADCGGKTKGNENCGSRNQRWPTEHMGDAES
jgi:hypothetical protein